MTDVLVIGAGASGLMAAITAAREGASVLVLEKMKQPGRKILTTGNGRCNLTHLDDQLAARYHSEDREILPAMAKHLLAQYDVQRTLDTFAALGLLWHDRDGYVYPRSDQAASVLAVLLEEAQRLGVKIKYATPVTDLEQAGAYWKVHTEGWAYEAKRVILACGSKAAPATGSTGDGYALAKNLGHRIVPVVPALTALTVPKKRVKEAAGARTDARVTLVLDEKTRYSEAGQVQWSEGALSGIVIFQLSRYVSRAMTDGMTKPYLEIDFVPEMQREDLTGYLYRLSEHRGLSEETPWKDKALHALLRSCVPDRIADMLSAAYAKMLGDTKADRQRRCEVLAGLLKGFVLPVTGTRDFDQAQVCAGGVALSEIQADTLESRRCPGLFFAGEILDVDGPCGGYNLQWAWSTGMAAGSAAAKG